MHPRLQSAIAALFAALILSFAAPARAAMTSAKTFDLPKGVTLPSKEGVYIFDGATFTELPAHQFGPESKDPRSRTFPERSLILVYEKWISQPIGGVLAMPLLDFSSIGFHPMDTVPAGIQTLADNADMLMIVPDHPLTAGLYMLELGAKEHEYYFGVETPDLEAYWWGVLKQFPQSWQADNHLGALLYERGDTEGAGALFKKAEELEPDVTEVHNNVALVLSAQHKYDEAAKEFALAVKITDLSSINTNLANTYNVLGRYDDAIPVFKHALELDPKNVSAQCNLGIALMKKGKTDEAITEFISATELDPQSSVLRDNLKDALKQRGIDTSSPSLSGTYPFDAKKALQLIKGPAALPSPGPQSN